MHVAVVLGTRPEIIKLAPIVHQCQRTDLECTIVHTGQHYSEELDSVFFEQLELPEPDYDLGVGSGTHGDQTAEMLQRVATVLRAEAPDTVLVQGDTNSVLAGAIATSKLDVQLGHVEAGLRSFDRNMPEEINRIVADHVSDVLFAPTPGSASNLREEGIPDARIAVTGNTVVDAVQRNRSLADEKSTVLSELDLEGDSFFLVTAHRAENVDDEDRFGRILDGVARAAAVRGVDAIYPIHPRARERIDEFGLTVPEQIRLIDPQDYLDFLRLESAADLIVTDSGGVQEEACILGVPCVTVRDSTERPETVEVGANTLSDVDPERIVRNVGAMIEANGEWENPFGDGDAAARILDELTPATEVITA